MLLVRWGGYVYWRACLFFVYVGVVCLQALALASALLHMPKPCKNLPKFKNYLQNKIQKTPGAPGAQPRVWDVWLRRGHAAALVPPQRPRPRHRIRAHRHPDRRAFCVFLCVFCLSLYTRMCSMSVSHAPLVVGCAAAARARPRSPGRAAARRLPIAINTNTNTMYTRTKIHMCMLPAGLAIYNGHILEFQFPPALYKMLLGGPPGLGDLADLHPEVGLFSLFFRVFPRVGGPWGPPGLGDLADLHPEVGGGGGFFLLLFTHFPRVGGPWGPPGLGDLADLHPEVGAGVNGLWGGFFKQGEGVTNEQGRSAPARQMQLLA